MALTAIDRSIPVGGPAYATFNGVTFQMAADWTASEVLKTGEINSNLQGLLQHRDETVAVMIKATPLAIWGSLSTLYPYTSASKGNLIFGSSDLPLVIQTKAGKSITYASAAVYEMPKLNLTPMASKNLFGELTFVCLIANSTLQSTANSLYTLASSAYTEPTLDPTTVQSPLYQTAWGASPTGNFANIDTEAGVEFTPTVKLTPVPSMITGIGNYRVEEVRAKVELSPTNLTETDYLTNLIGLQGTGTGPGTPRAQAKFTCIGQVTGNPSLTIAAAAVMSGGLRFGKDGRINKLSLEAVRVAVTSVLQPQFVLTTV